MMRQPTTSVLVLDNGKNRSRSTSVSYIGSANTGKMALIGYVYMMFSQCCIFYDAYLGINSGKNSGGK